MAGFDFTFAVAGRITGMRYYRSPSATSSSRWLRVWQGPNPGTLLGSVQTSGDSGSGWKTASFATPIAVTAAQTLRCVMDDSINELQAYSGALSMPLINGDVRIVSDWVKYNGFGTFPTTGPAGDNYFVDVIFEAGSAPPDPWPVAVQSGAATTHSHVEADLPTTLATDTEVTSAITTHAAAADPHTGYQKETEKAAASGYASLDGSTKVPIAQLPTGTSSTTVAIGNDARLSDARTPTAHNHAATEITTGVVDLARLGTTPAATEYLKAGGATGSADWVPAATIKTDLSLDKVTNTKITVASSAPGSPATGDVWIDTT